ncbi:hypothetical protein [Desulfovibrio sp. MES5]|uniref:hypothetical protein n=1 Tax=Desulfovibrio sp. MES5 TaxID=1899016 RepID=UPI0025C60FF6|nr:hypothetical protein [Desulfovibrio sp. MES5]
MTQETTLEDSMRNDMVCPMQSLSPSVSLAGNGCRETTLEDSMRNDMVCPMQSLSPSVTPSGNGSREDSTAVYLRCYGPKPACLKP